MTQTRPISILCVDDNISVVKALEVKLARTGLFDWKGSLPRANDLVATAVRENPFLVLLDVDMPGVDPFTALAELSDRCPNTRVVIFSGHVRRELVQRAVDSGAWGYVSKNDGEDELIKAIQGVAEGEFALSPEVQRIFAL